LSGLFVQKDTSEKSRRTYLSIPYGLHAIHQANYKELEESKKSSSHLIAVTKSQRMSASRDRHSWLTAKRGSNSQPIIPGRNYSKGMTVETTADLSSPWRTRIFLVPWKARLYKELCFKQDLYHPCFCEKYQWSHFHNHFNAISSRLPKWSHELEARTEHPLLSSTEMALQSIFVAYVHWVLNGKVLWSNSIGYYWFL